MFTQSYLTFMRFKASPKLEPQNIFHINTEFNALKQQIIKRFGLPPYGVFILALKTSPCMHYVLELASFEPLSDLEEVELLKWADNLERNFPKRWNSKAKKYLSENFHPSYYVDK